MATDQNGQDFDIVIVQCCQNCETHQYLSRHSEWKYFEQFNELKRKIQRFVNNTIVIKNPVPDELTKPPELKAQKNSYINKQTNEKVIFPRIGAFEIYIYNILISSKLISNSWPNHYKVIQILNKIIQEKKKGNSIDHFSVYQSAEQVQQKKKNKQAANLSSKKKKPYYRVYKSKDKASVEKSTQKTINNTVIDSKLGKLDPLQTKQPKKKIGSFGSSIPTRYLQSKNDKRVKLPSLRSTISYEKQSKKLNENTEKKNSESMKKIFNSIEQLQHQEISLIEKKQTQQNEKFQSLEFQGDSIDFKASFSQQKQLNDDDMKFIQNKSVQYSVRDAIKDYMNASIQYQEQEGYKCDFGLQIDDQSIPKETINQFIQTFLTGDDFFKGKQKQKVYMLDQQITVNIPVIKDEKTIEIQTNPTPIQNAETNTQVKNYVHRSAQFPQQQSEHKQGGLHPIDTTFAHMYQKRRNIIDNDYYSVDKFEERATKYKWTGKANLNQQVDKLKQRIFLQSLVFSVYKFFGIKTPIKKLSFQHCGNIVNDKVKEACYHIMTLDDPELHYFFQFQQFDYQKKKFPLSEVLTFKNSKQTVKFSNYGGFLALAYFLNDTELFHETHTPIGLTITNQEVKEIHKLSSEYFDLHPAKPNQPYEIGVMEEGKYKIKFQRLSENIQFQFITMVSRITGQNTLLQLSRFVREIFLHNSPTHKDFKDTLISLNLQTINEQLIEDFIKVLEFRVNRLKEQFGGQIYCYNTYRSLNPQISFSMKPEVTIQRKMKYDGKIVSYSDVFKHIRSKDNIVIITGQSGIGKTFIMQGLVNKLKESQQINVLQIDDIGNQASKYQNELQEKVKNVIFMDNAEKYIAYISTFIRNNLNKSQISYCLMSKNDKIADRLQAQLKQMKVIKIVLEKMGKEDIQAFLLKSISSQSYTAKKEIIEKCISKSQFRKLLGNPFYARQYARYLSTIDIQKYQPTVADVNKYSILKHSFHHVIEVHKKQCKALNLRYRQALPLLRKIALQYFHNDQKIDDNVKSLVLQNQTDELIKNQLCYYPIFFDNLQIRKSLFMHQQYFNYILVEAYSYFIQKGYRDMKMEKIYENFDLMQLITQKYKNQRGYGRLLQVVYNTRKFKNTYEQASNAMSLLCRMKYLFSNLNFDEVQIPQADLSDAVFYQCSFRSANLAKALLYKTNMISCQVDNAEMSSLDLLNKKFDLQFIALTTSLSPDGKHLALGCGNYLIILNTDSGKQIKRIQAHLDVIRTVKYSKDGSSLISIADDKTLRIWDVQSYRSVVFKLPQKGSINFSNQTETIASISKNALKVWNLKSMAGQAYCQGHSDIITCVHFSRDGNWILTGSRDCTLRLWDLDGEEKYLYKGHNSEIIVGRIAPTNKLIFSSSKDKDLIAWNLFSRSQIKKKQFDDQVTQICPDLKQNFVVITFYGKPSIMVLDYHTLEPFYSIKAHNGRILSLSFDPYFKKIISLGKDKTVRLWEFAKMMKIQMGSKQYNIDDGPILALKYSKFDNIYATAHQNGQINIWYSQNHNLGVQLKSHNGPVTCLQFDKAGKLYSAGSDGAIRIWNIYEKKQIKNLKIHSQQVISLKLSHKNKLIVSTSKANELVVQDITGVNVIMSTRQEGRVHAVQFSKDDSIMAIGGVQRYAVIYQINEIENSLVRLQQLGEHADTVQSLCFHSDSILIVGLKNGNVVIWNHHKGSLIKKIQNPSAIRSILTFQKKFIVISTEDGKIRVIDMDKGKQMKIFRHSDPALAMDINKTQNLLYTGTEQGNVLVWNLDSVHPYPPKVNFDRIAVDAQCSQIISIQGPYLLMKKDLFNHSQQQIQVKLQSQIEGVTFIDQKIVVLLKSGQYWQLGKGQFTFQSNISYEGDLFYMRDKKYLNLYKTPVKKIKNLKLPVQLILQEQT